MTTQTAKRWCFTLNNPTELIAFDEDRMEYLIFQKERGERGTVHYQGFVILKKQSRMSALKKLISKQAHFEVARGSVEQNIAYCSKEDTKIDGPFTFGEVPNENRGKRTDIEKFKDWVDETENPCLDDAMVNYPNVYAKYRRFCADYINLKFKVRAQQQYKEEKFKEVIVYYGAPGTGKTRKVYKDNGVENVYKISMGDGTSKSLWFDDYNGEEVLLLDDFYGQIKVSYMLQLLDIYPMRLQTKGGYTYGNFKKIYITSNKHPSEWYSFDNVDVKEALYRRLKTIEEFTIFTDFFAEPVKEDD